MKDLQYFKDQVAREKGYRNFDQMLDLIKQGDKPVETAIQFMTYAAELYKNQENDFDIGSGRIIFGPNRKTAPVIIGHSETITKNKDLMDYLFKSDFPIEIKKISDLMDEELTFDKEGYSGDITESIKNVAEYMKKHYITNTPSISLKDHEPDAIERQPYRPPAKAYREKKQHYKNLSKRHKF